jgi:hypothetical protein
VSNLHFDEFAVVIQVEWRHFYAQLVKFPVGLPYFRDEAETVFAPGLALTSDECPDTLLESGEARRCRR